MIIFLCLTNNERLFRGLLANLQARDPAVEVLGLRGCSSMASGYNEAEARLGPPSGDGREILGFIHQDARLHFDYYSIVPHYFATLDRAGVVGFVGTDEMATDGYWWARGRCYGGLLQGEAHPSACRYLPVPGHQPVEVVDGYCLFIRRDVFHAIGRFDERFDHWHFYDIDLCLSALSRGYQNYVIARSTQHFSPGSYDAAWRRQREKYLAKWGGVLKVRESPPLPGPRPDAIR